MREKMEFPSVIHPFNKYLLNFYLMPGTVLIGFNSAGDTALAPQVLPALGGGGGVGKGGGRGSGTEDTGSVRTV